MVHKFCIFWGFLHLYVVLNILYAIHEVITKFSCFWMMYGSNVLVKPNHNWIDVVLQLSRGVDILYNLFPISTGKCFPSLLGNVSHPYWERFPISHGMVSHPDWETFPIHWGAFVNFLQFTTNCMNTPKDKLFPKGFKKGNFSRMIIHE